jgi:hypothetical protein
MVVTLLCLLPSLLVLLLPFGVAACFIVAGLGMLLRRRPVELGASRPRSPATDRVVAVYFLFVACVLALGWACMLFYGIASVAGIGSFSH